MKPRKNRPKPPHRAAPRQPAARGVGGGVGGLVTRIAAARAIGMSDTGLRRWEATGRAHPVVRDGVHYYSRDEIERLRAARAQSAAPDHGASERTLPACDDGKLAARVFEALDAGTLPVAIVRELQVSPAALGGLLGDYERLRGGLFLDRAALDRLANTSPRFKRGFEAREDLATALLTALQLCEACVDCSERATLCKRCARQAFARPEPTASRPPPVAMRPAPESAPERPPPPRMPRPAPAATVEPEPSPASAAALTETVEQEVSAYLDQLEAKDPDKLHLFAKLGRALEQDAGPANGVSDGAAKDQVSLGQGKCERPTASWP